jgi:hypothetical protein
MSESATSLGKPAGQLSEVELVRRVRDGDADLFYELVRPYERRVYSAAFAILRIAADAERRCARGHHKGLPAHQAVS